MVKFCFCDQISERKTLKEEGFLLLLLLFRDSEDSGPGPVVSDMP